MKKLLLILLLGTLLYAENRAISTGSVSGRITDRKTESELAAVNVIVENTEMGTMSDENGNYSISGLSAGSYHLRFSMIGYEELIKLNVEVHPGNYTTLNVELIPSYVELDGITVTAPAFQKSKGAIVSERSIDLSEIRTDPGNAADIQRSVQVLPSVVSGADQSNEIITRGGNPGENLFVMDDIEIPNANHFGQQGTGGGPINLINAEFIQNIDFYAGAFPAMFGDKASSVMNIQFREGSREKRQYYVDLGMSGVGGSFEGPLSKNGSYLVTYHKSYLDLVVSNIGLTAVPHYWNTQAKVVQQLSTRNKLIVNAVYGKDNIEIDSRDDGESWSRGAEYVRTDGYIYATGATLQTNWSASSYSKLTVYRNSAKYAYDVKRYQQDDLFADYYLQDDYESETAVKGYYARTFSNKSDLQTGFQIKSVDFDYTHNFLGDTLLLYYPDGSTAIDTVLGPTNFIKDQAAYKNSAFLSYTFRMGDHLQVISGIRTDHFTMNGETSLSPRVGLSYSFNPVLQVNLAYGKHFQTPHAFQIMANDSYEANHPSADLSQLKSKYTDQYVAGVEFYPEESMKFSLEVYRKLYHDLILYNSDITTDTEDYPEYFLNAGKGRSYGVELFFHKKLFDEWYTIVSYSYSNTEQWDPRYEVWYPADYDYRNVFNIVGGYRWLKQNDWGFVRRFMTLDADEFNMSVRYRYMGGRPYSEMDYDPIHHRWYVPADGLYNTSRYPEYSRLDLAFQWRVRFHNSYLVSYLNIQNFFNTKNIWSYTYNEDGTISEVLQFQTFPVGGFIFEF